MIMATEKQVKEYLAYWFQLGKKILLFNTKVAILPQPVIERGKYSAAFEKCWARILAAQGHDYYLEGTEQTIAELFSSKWVMTSCPKCTMPVPIIDMGVSCHVCPCYDLPDWPNNNLPLPRSPVNSQDRLKRIQQRLGDED